ncbi:2OGFeDO domain, nucleic acid-modifying type [Ceraceosorus bombacis]|uniref:2OGFeDO domain, nucleic acid-modifying type n=1 Tax=Ceraceosorus bombacis TaxID=401625 RepID=A0A0P1BCY2_9BASI|nr:2OGFeDO domain, nucleic acid-modifying type [Ceraceosorus bombacis]
MDSEHPPIATRVEDIIKNANSHKPAVVAIAKALQRAFKPVQKRKRDKKPPSSPEKKPSLSPEKQSSSLETQSSSLETQSSSPEKKKPLVPYEDSSSALSDVTTDNGDLSEIEAHVSYEDSSALSDVDTDVGDLSTDGGDGELSEFEARNDGDLSRDDGQLPRDYGDGDLSDFEPRIRPTLRRGPARQAKRTVPWILESSGGSSSEGRIGNADHSDDADDADDSDSDFEMKLSARRAKRKVPSVVDSDSSDYQGGDVDDSDSGLEVVIVERPRRTAAKHTSSSSPMPVLATAAEDLTHELLMTQGRQLAQRFLASHEHWTIVDIPHPARLLFRAYQGVLDNVVVRMTICLEYDIDEEAEKHSGLPRPSLYERINRARARATPPLNPLPKDEFNNPRRDPTWHLSAGNNIEWDLILDCNKKLFTVQRWSLPKIARSADRAQPDRPNTGTTSGAQAENGRLWRPSPDDVAASMQIILNMALKAEADVREAEAEAQHMKEHIYHHEGHARHLALAQKRRCHANAEAIAATQTFGAITTKLLLWSQALSLPAFPIEPSRSCNGTVFGALHAHLRAAGTSRATLADTNFNAEIKDYRDEIVPFVYGKACTHLLNRMRKTMAFGFSDVYKKYNDVRLHRELINVLPRRALRAYMSGEVTRNMERRRAAMMAPWCSAAINMPTPFTGMTAHRDKRDTQWGLCVVAALGDFTGAELCLDDVGIAIHSRPMDITVFPSALNTHRNANNLVGTRMSLVAFTQHAILDKYSTLPTSKDFSVWPNAQPNKRKGKPAVHVVASGDAQRSSP